jgi:hypothetical protein
MNTGRQLHFIVIGLFVCGTVFGADYRYPLKISGTNPRLLVDQDDVPFLMVGDNPHSILAKLPPSDAALYLADRAKYGFNSLWIDIVCYEYTGGRADGCLYDGTKPFTKTIPGTRSFDLTAPNEAYFAYADQVLRMAGSNGMVVLLDPLETGAWLQTALDNGSDRCRAYGQYLGNRYKDFPNIIWLNGNDYQQWSVATNDAVMTSVALGIKDTDPNHLQTIELNYDGSSSLDDPNWAPIVNLNFAYTYYAPYAEVLHAYNQSPTLPVFLGEANYEYETNKNEDGGSPVILRMQGYWTLLSGGIGQLYGNHYIWPFLPGWKTHLDSPGVTQLDYLVDLFSARKWYDLVPDQKHTFVTAGYGHFLPNAEAPPATATHGRYADNNYVTAALTPDGTLGMAYLPKGGTITVAMNRLKDGITARWFDPADNTFRAIAGSPFSNRIRYRFTAPGMNSDGDPDWVLVLEASVSP